jgi:alpha-tubulin suppressor-like RCC1 family protein
MRRNRVARRLLYVVVMKLHTALTLVLGFVVVACSAAPGEGNNPPPPPSNDDAGTTLPPSSDGGTPAQDASVQLQPVKGLSKIATGEYQSFFLVDGQIYALGYGENIGTKGQSKGVPLPIDVPASVRFVDVQSGLHQTLAVDTTGAVWTWGTNGSGVGGQGTAGGELGAPAAITQDAYGNAFGNGRLVYSRFAIDFLVKGDGTVWTWGDVSKGYSGDPNVSGVQTRPIQVPMPSGVKVKKLAMSAMMLALAGDGSVYAWGNVGGYGNSFDQASGGDGNKPMKVQGLPADIVDIASSTDFNYALTSDGDLWGWGLRGAFMGFSDGRALTPQVLNASLGLQAKVAAIGVNDETTHVVLTDGTLWGWGANGQGEVGNLAGPDYAQTQGNYSVWGGTQVMVTMPVQIAPSVKSFKAVFASPTFAFYTFAMTDDGHLYFMGRNKTGIAGDGIYPAAASGNYYAGEDVMAVYPNSWDVPLAKSVSPMTLTTGTATLSPACIANPNVAPCTDK